jgi:hypothetical protein
MYVWLTAIRRSLLQCPRVKYCVPAPVSVSTYGTSAIKGKGRQVSSFDISDALEKQGERILRVVKAKVEERQKLLEVDVIPPTYDVKASHLEWWPIAKWCSR